MSDSALHKPSFITPAPQQLLSLTFQPKNPHSIEEILDTIKAKCIGFESFKELKKSLFYQVLHIFYLAIFKKKMIFRNFSFFS